MRTLIAFLLLLLASTLTMSQIPSYVPAQGLLAWYSFDGNSNDFSPNGNHLTNYSATLTADRYGNPSSAYSFNGSSSYLINNTPSFIMSSTSSFTVSLWMYKQVTSAGVMLMHGSTAAGNFIYLLQTGSGNTLQFGTNKQQSPWIWAQSSYNLNVWHHLVGVYNNGLMTFYVNGSPVAGNQFIHTGVTSALLPFYVGRGVSGNYFNGIIDDVGVWNRALSQAEITDLFLACVPVIGGTVTITECDSYASPSGTTYTLSGTYMDTLNTTLGCDSIITLNLTINQSTQGSETVTGCFEYVSPSGQYTWTSTGIYHDTLQNAADCDSVITVNLTINTVDTSVVLTSVTLTAVAQNATFRWLNCDQGFSVIPGATSNVFIAQANGDYAVEVTQNGCVDTSSCYVINSVGFGDVVAGAPIIVYPNPSKGVFWVMNLGLEGEVHVKIFDVAGKQVLRTSIRAKDLSVNGIDLSWLETGTYLLELSSASGNAKQSLIIRR